MTAKQVNYRRLAFAHYDPLCAHCGFGVPAVLEVAHLDCNRQNNDIGNLVILCPNCHKMHDLDLISTATIIEMRDRPKVGTHRAFTAVACSGLRLVTLELTLKIGDFPL